MAEVHVLTNGITVVLDRMDAIRSVSIGIFVKVGSAHETREDNGVSHVLEHMFFKGTNKRTVRALADDMARVGGIVNAYTSKECTAFYATTIDVHLRETVELLADMLTDSLFDGEELEREKEVILEEIDMYEDSAEDLVHDKLQQAIWKDSSLGFAITGEKDGVAGFTREDLFAFRDAHYHGGRIVISISGRMEERKVLSWLEEYFHAIPLGGREGVVEAATYHKAQYRKSMDIEQVHLNIAFEGVGTRDEGRYAMMLGNAILGGNDNSHLFQKIREDQGLTYSIFSYLSSFLRGGLLHVDAVLNPSKLDAVYGAIFQVIEEIRRDGVREEELEMAKEQYKIETLIAMEGTKNRMNYFGSRMMNHGTVHSPEEGLKRVERVTRDEIGEAFNRCLVEERCSVALVGKSAEARTVT